MVLPLTARNPGRFLSQKTILTLVPSPPLLFTVGTPEMRTQHPLAEEAKDNHTDYCMALNLKRPELAL